ncbi:MAG: DUF4157 domain-containing protein [Nostoc sp.]|uniref:eCIS core domain-containing protein n=1 Tax=Nostoc sp. TaxID=1180 RepID=UPI002FF74847
MHEPKQDKNANTKTDRQQTAVKNVSQNGLGIAATPRDPLVQQVSRMGNAPNPSAHAAILNRAPANQQSSNRQLLLQLQQQYGNPYVNQVLQLARGMDGITPEDSTPKIQPKISSLQRQEMSPKDEEEDKPVQMKPEITSLQRQEMSPKDEEEDKPAQMKPEISSLQRQEMPPKDEEEDKPAQMKPEISSLQRQEMSPKDEEEDKPVQMKPEISSLQRQEMPPNDEEEDKPVQMKPLIQAKLTINPAGDKYEQEADRVADQVVQRMNASEVGRSPESGAIQREDMPEQVQKKPEISTLQRQEMSQEDEEHKLAQKQPQSVVKKSQNKTAPDEEDKLTQKKPKTGATQQQQPEEEQQDKLANRTKKIVQKKSANQPTEANTAGTQNLEGSIQQAQGGGQAIPEKTRQPIEQAFGADFSGVKIHTNTQSDQLNKSIQARAFTTGQNIFFRQGAYEPGSQSGQKLLAHELTHVVQQNGSAVQAKSVSKKENKVQTKPLVTRSSSQPEPIVQCKKQNSPETTKPDNKQSPKEQEQTQPDNKQGQPTQPIPPAGDTAQGKGQPQAPASGGATNPPPATTAGGGAGSASQGESGNDADSTKAPAMAEAIASPMTGEQKAPTSPQQDPAFQAVTSNAETVAQEQQEHQPAKEKAEEAQAAAEPPTNEVDSKAQANQVGEMQQTETPEFDAVAFKAKLMQKIADMAPKNLKEADEFKNNNKLDSVKEELGDKVNEEQKTSQGPLEEKTNETPDTSGIEPKTVEPLPPTEPGEVPTDINAQKAAPKSKGESEVEAPLQEDSKKLDKQMADADITEEQLAKSNEPEFQATLKSKGEAQTNAQEAPPKYREDEQGLVSTAEGAAVATAQEQMQGMHDTRAQQLDKVADKQAGTKGKDEEARTKVATDINKIYEDTKAKVEKTLSDLDTQVGQEFDNGAAEAKKVFEDYVDQRMKEYKKKRYGGAFGWLRWIGDKLFGMPSEVNAFYQEGRDLYIQKMDVVIDKVVTIISQGLTQAKAEIANGKQEIQNYLDKLPEDLQEVGQEAAADIQSKFEDLQQTVSDKEDELINSLSQKYQENLKAVDDRIEEMKEENKGLIQKAIEFIVDTIKTIIELGKLLLKVLARVASVIPQILKDPIGFFKNLVKAIKQGFENFVKNIAQHLKEGLITWLTGTLAGTGIEMPKTFDLPGIFSLVTQVLGLTPETIEARATERLQGGTGERSQPAGATKQGKQGKGGRQTPQATQTGQTPQTGQGRDSTQNTAQNSPMSPQTTADNGNQENSALAETGFDIFKILSTQGVAGLWELVKDKIGDLKAMVLDPIQTFVTETIIQAGIEWIISLMNPASAFVKACKAIYEILKFFMDHAEQIADLINAILDSIEAIAKGAIDQAVKMVEGALAKSVPVIIGFLASLLGLGGISEKVQAIIQKVQRPIEKAIDWVIEQGVKAGNKVGNKVKESKAGKKVGDGVDSAKQKGEAAQQGVSDKQEPAQNKFDEKKGATRDKFGKDKGGKSNQKPSTEKGKRGESKPEQNSKANRDKNNNKKDQERHKLLVQKVISELEQTDGKAKDYKTIRAEKEAQAKRIEKSYTAKLKKGIKLRVDFENAAKDEKDGYLNFKVVIAPNDTTASSKIDTYKADKPKTAIAILADKFGNSTSFGLKGNAIQPSIRLAEFTEVREEVDRPKQVKATIVGTRRTMGGRDPKPPQTAIGHLGVHERAIMGRPRVPGAYAGGHLISDKILGADSYEEYNLAPQLKDFNSPGYRNIEERAEKGLINEKGNVDTKVSITATVDLRYPDQDYKVEARELVSRGVVPNLGTVTPTEVLTIPRRVPSNWKITLEFDSKNYPKHYFTSASIKPETKNKFKDDPAKLTRRGSREYAFNITPHSMAGLGNIVIGGISGTGGSTNNKLIAEAVQDYPEQMSASSTSTAPSTLAPATASTVSTSSTPLSSIFAIPFNINDFTNKSPAYTTLGNRFDTTFPENLANAVNKKRVHNSSIDVSNFHRLLTTLPTSKRRKKDDTWMKQLKYDPNIKFT